MARRGGRRRGRRTGSQRRASQKAKRASRSPSKSSTSSKSKSTKKKSRKPMGRSRHTPGGQHAANKNQNKKAKRTVKSVKKAIRKKVGDISSKVKKGFSIGKDAYGKALRGAAASAATHVANSRFASDYNNPNARDRSKMTPQQIRRFERLSQKTGMDYFSPRKVVGRINLSADTLSRLGRFNDAGWYKGLTKAIPGIKSLRINKTFYGRDRVKGWHSSQRPGRGHGLKDMIEPAILKDEGYTGDKYIITKTGSRKPPMGPEPDWLSDLYRSHNIAGGKLDQGARDYWSNEAKTKGRDATIQSIIGTSKAQGTYGGRKKPRRINTGTPKAVPLPWFNPSTVRGLLTSGGKRRKANLQNKGAQRRMIKSVAATIAGIRGGVG